MLQKRRSLHQYKKRDGNTRVYARHRFLSWTRPIRSKFLRTSWLDEYTRVESKKLCFKLYRWYVRPKIWLPEHHALPQVSTEKIHNAEINHIDYDCSIGGDGINNDLPTMVSLNPDESEPSAAAIIPEQLANIPRNKLIYPDPVPTERDVIKIKRMYGCVN